MTDPADDIAGILDGWQQGSIDPRLRLDGGARTIAIRATRWPSIEEVLDKTDTEVRIILFAHAEVVLDTLHSRGWKLCAVPSIELTGRLIHGMGTDPYIQHRCDLRVEVTR